MTSEFGKRLTSLLKARGMTQKQLAEKLEMSEITISRYVTGERQPSAEAVTKIAKELGTTGDYLMGTQNASPENSGSGGGLLGGLMITAGVVIAAVALAKAAGLLSSSDSEKIKDILDSQGGVK